MAISPTSPRVTSPPSSSTSRISTPRMGVPIDPGLRSACGWLNEATGEVSDSPYPSSTMQPKVSSNERMTSTGIADPPETHSRRLDMSRLAGAGWCSIAENIVGTPWKIVTPSRSITDRALPPSNRGMSVSEAPGQDAGVQRAGQPEDVEERQAAHDHVVRRRFQERLLGRAGVAVQAGVRELGTLGLSRRP